MRKAIWFAVVCIAIWPSVGFSEDSTSPCGPPGAACAPYFRDLPDIVIGDTGDISGTGTTALRLYRYLNILNLLDPNVVEWRNWGTLGDRSVFLYQPTASEPTIQASRTSAVGGFVNPLTGSEYVGLMGSGIAPGPGANILDAATTFTYLSLMNTDIMTGSPTDAYSATAAVNGMQTVLIPGGDLGDTDLILVGSALPLPTTSPTLIFEAPFVVTTMMDSGDYTTGATDVLFDFQFPGGSAENWAVNTDFGLADFGAATTSIDTTNGGIGWDATGAGGGALGANY
ncbi:hypothetical protein JW916_10695, partial [Candidatus Sumerlaeota bacterium]|nr:hypothetical protein [Candidatus Sumerlaeota bacterium]